ncbi:Biotin carboxylase / Biotin carboxyl carrier protein [Paraburkholderia unamae]|uniref:acetyl-CoA carboxylase biotin carboxylase subunit n=1 Tax=Paraburkholderia unamae TaxID=219649 RepID=UPI001CB555AD|nr:acetyl-CoA carboxylase biotin carboxylase subunit [Paraburkholderia unamae]CAG9271541.1 Biotin carboxylase / Biotin carboxyl carrier protein [Paraburkholderia unamae]
MNSSTPFSKILIANRGEIALRVIRSARALGYRTVAVYSTADAQSAHVTAADQSVWVGESLPAQSYLRIPAIIDAARVSGADAVHPGYGFLAENEDFAAACRAAGLVFIGPSPEAIHSMGDKAGAKRLMIEAGVPCIPGYQGEDQSEQRLSEEAARIGYPVMIKATAGGGGRGMRLVSSGAEFADLLRSAQSEARNAFGDATVILERAIVEPRHIEIQVFADRHGNAVHLGERDCSVQRRHQKVIEEAPSPAVNVELRARMGATAVAAAKAIAYEGAGTLEFLLDREGNYYFMEMNTRLQVEHPVTEAITGLDLVEWQLRVAAGETLPLTQDDICFSGHAIEVRLCAEDVRAGFMPQSGTMRRWEMPRGLRVEHGLSSGTSIPPFYDSMIAKLIAYGTTRDEARRRLIRGVEDTVALGVQTNQEFLARCLAHRVFAAGGATTAFIAQHDVDLVPADEKATERAALVGAWLLHETGKHVRHGTSGRRLAHALPRGMRFALDGATLEASISQFQPHLFKIALQGKEHTLESVCVSENEARFILDGVMERIAYDRDGPSLWLRHAGRPHVLEDHTGVAASRKDESGSDGRVRASMNGRVVAVFAAVGDRVQPGQPLLTLEAMKMEHVHSAPVQGVVTALLVSVDEQVQAKRVVVEILPDDAQGATK